MKKGFWLILLLAVYSKNYSQNNSEEIWDATSIKTCHINKSNLKDTVCKNEIKAARPETFIVLIKKNKDSYKFIFRNTCIDEIYTYFFLKNKDGVYKNEEKSISFTIINQTNNNATYRLIKNLNFIKNKEPIKEIEYYYCQTLK